MDNFKQLQLDLADILYEAAKKAGPLKPLPKINWGKKRSIPKFVNPKASLYKHSSLEKNIDFSKYIKF